MQQRKSLGELAAEIERQETQKRDFVVPSNKLAMVLEDAKPKMQMRFDTPDTPFSHYERFDVNELAHGQIASKLGIPKTYYDKMKAQAPDLLTENVNTWLQKNEPIAPMPERVRAGTRLSRITRQTNANLVRVLDGNVRAFLSDAYRPIDNMVVAQAVLPVLLNSGMKVEIKSSEITERRLYLQVVTPQIQGIVRKDEIVQAGITISNSEVGCGSFWFANLLYFLACLNGAIGNVDMRKYHVGSRLGNDINQIFNYTERTNKLNDAAFMSAIQDMTKASLQQLDFDRQIKMLNEAANRELHPNNVTFAIQEVTKKYGFTEKESEGILTRMIKGSDLTQYGLSGAITNLANDDAIVPDYDRVIELEKVGGEIMTWGDKTWNEFQKAA